MAPPPTVQAPATVTAPPPKDVPWWGALILAILTAIVSVIATVFYLRGNRTIPGAPPGMGQIFTDIVIFIPHILILFGILADIFTLQGAYSIPSLVGLASLPLHKLAEYLWLGVATLLGEFWRLASTREAAPAAAPLTGGAMSAWSGCDVYGFEYFHSRYAPQGLVVTSTIFWYYIIELLTNRNALDSVAAILAFALFFIMQMFQLNACPVFTDSTFIKSFIALSEGFFIGGIGYATVQAAAPNRLPSAVLPRGPSLDSMTKNADGSYTGPDGKTIYVVGPDGRPIPQSFFTETANSSAAAQANVVAALGPAAAATTCPT